MPGQPRVPYDRTDPMVEVPAPTGGAPGLGADLGGGAQGAGGAMPQADPADLGALLGGLGGGEQSGAGALGNLGGVGQSTDDLTGTDLGAMGGDVGSAEDIEVAQMLSALQDPNTPPDVMQAIQQQLALAARRRLAGVGQEQGQPPAMGGGLGA